MAAQFADAARRAQDAGLGVNAGHDLSQDNLGTFLRAVPGVLEVSIGHALIGEALYEGLDATVQRYLRILGIVLERIARRLRRGVALRQATPSLPARCRAAPLRCASASAQAKPW